MLLVSSYKEIQLKYLHLISPISFDLYSIILFSTYFPQPEIISMVVAVFNIKHFTDFVPFSDSLPQRVLQTLIPPGLIS